MVAFAVGHCQKIGIVKKDKHPCVKLQEHRVSHLSKARSLTRIRPSGVAKDTDVEPIKHAGDKGHK